MERIGCMLRSRTSLTDFEHRTLRITPLLSDQIAFGGTNFEWPPRCARVVEIAPRHANMAVAAKADTTLCCVVACCFKSQETFRLFTAISNHSYCGE